MPDIGGGQKQARLLARTSLMLHFPGHPNARVELEALPGPLFLSIVFKEPKQTGVLIYTGARAAFLQIGPVATLFFRPGAHIMSHNNPLRGLGALAIGTDKRTCG